MAYGYIGSMRTRPGCRDKVAEILVGGADALREVGCQLYVISVSETDPDIIWSSEVWDTKEAHDASLLLPEAKAAIAEVLPMLTGEFAREELTVVGGLGVR